MTTLCIVPCGSSKIWDRNPSAGPTQARSVYIGPFAGKCLEYAEIFYPGSWRILSAKYGFLKHDDIVPCSYNTTFNDKRTNPISIGELIDQAKEFKLFAHSEVISLGGLRYVEIAQEVFSGIPVRAPLRGCSGIGVMMKKLKDAIASKTEL